MLAVIEAQRMKRACKEAGIRGYELARDVHIDPAMVSYIYRGNRCSVRVAVDLANAIIKRLPDAEVIVSEWMLALGFAPPRLRTATREGRLRALEAVGVKVVKR